MTNLRTTTGQATGMEDWVMRDVRLRASRARLRSRILRRLLRRMLGAMRLRLPSTSGDRSAQALRCIAPDVPLVLAAHAVRRIFCVEGTAWITAGDGQDYILRAGEAVGLQPEDSVIISAVKDRACVRLQAPHADLTPAWPAVRGWLLSSGGVRSR